MKRSKQQKKGKRRSRRINPIRIILLAVLVIGLLWGAKTVYLFFSPIELRASTVQAEYKEKYNPLDNVKGVFLGDKEDVTIEGKVDVNTIGEYPITYKYKDYTKDAVIVVADTKGPEMTVKDLTVDMNEEVTPESFVESISDASGYELTFKEDTDLTDEGRHKLTLVATDGQDNVTEAKVTLKRHNDRSAPQVDGTREERTVKQGTEFSLKDLEVTDDLDPNPVLTFDTSSIDMTTPGKYNVQITATDRSGNSRDYTQKVTVEENPEYGNNVVYLTFDDGPSQLTSQILDILDKYDVKATFFVTGNGQDYNDNIERAYEAGHAIGLHTYTHDFNSVYSSTDAYFDDLQKISDMVEDITGEQSKIIRFPGGSSNTISASVKEGIMTELVDLVHDKGYEYFDWNVSSSDASGNGIPADQIVASSTACEAQYCTILMHDSPLKSTTVEALPKIIEYYKNKGYIFLPLTVDSPAAHHGVTN